MSTATTDLPAGAGPLPTLPGVNLQHQWLDLPAGRFHVARAGDPSKPALLLLHGFPQSWWCWHGVIEELAAEAHLVMPDLRGHGWSAVPTEPGSYKKAALAEDIRDLLDALSIDSIAVAGHDWGGWTAQLLALAHPERVRRLLALSIPPVIPGKTPPLRSMLRMYYQLVFSAPGSTKLMGHTKRFAHGLRQDVQRPEVFTRDDALLYARPYADPVRAKAAQMMYRSFILGDARGTMRQHARAEFAMPVRFVLSAFDAYIPPEFADTARALKGDVEVLVQDRTGHFLPDEDPQFTAQELRDWLLPAAVPIGG